MLAIKVALTAFDASTGAGVWAVSVCESEAWTATGCGCGEATDSTPVRGVLVVGVAGAGCAAGGATEFIAGALVAAGVLALAPIAVAPWLSLAALGFAENVCDALTLGGGAGVGFCETDGKLRLALAWSEAPLV